jgi:hypothetical protein
MQRKTLVGLLAGATLVSPASSRPSTSSSPGQRCRGSLREDEGRQSVRMKGKMSMGPGLEAPSIG